MTRRMMWITGAIVLAVGAGLGAYWVQRSGSSSILGRQAPDFELRDATGKAWRLSQEGEGRPVVLHFWASWCQPCLSEIPIWLEAARADTSISASGALWVAVSLDESWEKAHTILPSQGLPENVVSLLDHDQEVPSLYGTYQFPESYVLGRSHGVLKKWVGPQPWETVNISNIVLGN